MPRALSVALIEKIIVGFQTSAANLRAAGLVGIEIVASHGYLLGQFLNARVNLQTDPYSGSLKNRLRIIHEVIAAIRRGGGGDMILGIRLSGEEKDHDGIEADEMLNVEQAIARNDGLDYLNITAGTSAGLAGSTHIVPSMRFEARYTKALSAAIRSVVDKPVSDLGQGR